MTGRKYGLKGADAIAILQESRRLRFHARETDEPLARFTRIERKVLPQEPGLALPHCKFHSWIFTGQRVQGSDVINVSVSENNAADWRTQTLCRLADAGSRPGNAGIDQRESVVFPGQETIDHAEASQADKVFRLLDKLHKAPRKISNGNGSAVGQKFPADSSSACLQR